ncbi:MAG: response regulator [Anaerolineae bacterium]
MSRRVVCIEDEQDVIDLMRLILERQGYEFIEAHGALEGMETVERTIPDLVLLDLMMPNIDGWEVYDHLHGNPTTKDIPIIVVTARTQHDPRVTQMRIANSEYLVTKPFGPAQLVETIQHVLEKSSA